LVNVNLLTYNIPDVKSN